MNPHLPKQVLDRDSSFVGSHTAAAPNRARSDQEFVLNSQNFKDFVTPSTESLMRKREKFLASLQATERGVTSLHQELSLDGKVLLPAAACASGLRPPHTQAKPRLAVGEEVAWQDQVGREGIEGLSDPKYASEGDRQHKPETWPAPRERKPRHGFAELQRKRGAMHQRLRDLPAANQVPAHFCMLSKVRQIPLRICNQMSERVERSSNLEEMLSVGLEEEGGRHGRPKEVLDGAFVGFEQPSPELAPQIHCWPPNQADLGQLDAITPLSSVECCALLGF